MRTPALTLRPATTADSVVIFQWRNDPVTREMARAPNTVEFADHAFWFENVLLSPRHHVLIAQVAGDGVPDNGENRIGVLRFDSSFPDADNATDRQDTAGLSHHVSINLNPAWRGQGLGQKVLQAGCDRFRAHGHTGPLWAEIRQQNIASLKIFTTAGFTVEGECDTILRVSRED